MSLPNRRYSRLQMVSYNQNLKDAILTPASGSAIAIGKIYVANRSGSTVDVGFAYRQPNAQWEAGQIDDSATPDIIDDSSAAKSTSAGGFELFTVSTNNDGFYVQSVDRFNAVGMVIDTAASGGSPVFSYKYYNGTSMTALTPIQSATFTSTGYTYFLFAPPHDWAKGSTAAVGADSDKYIIEVIATTAPSSAGGLASDVRLYNVFEFYPQLATLNEVIEDFSEQEFVCPTGASVMPFFGGTASASNLAWVDYRIISRNT